MRNRFGAIAASAILAVGVLLIGVPPASATSQVGGWWTGVGGCSGITLVMQGHYQNEVIGPDYFTRADGYNVKTVSAYIRKISLTETYPDGQVAGRRDISFTGTAKASSTTGISAILLPWIPASRSVGARLILTVSDSLGQACTFRANIGQG